MPKTQTRLAGTVPMLGWHLANNDRQHPLPKQSNEWKKLKIGTKNGEEVLLRYSHIQWCIRRKIDGDSCWNARCHSLSRHTQEGNAPSAPHWNWWQHEHHVVLHHQWHWRRKEGSYRSPVSVNIPSHGFTHLASGLASWQADISTTEYVGSLSWMFPRDLPAERRGQCYDVTATKTLKPSTRHRFYESSHKITLKP